MRIRLVKISVSADLESTLFLFLPGLLVEKFERHGAVRGRRAGAEHRRNQRRFEHFSARRVRALGSLGVRFQHWGIASWLPPLLRSAHEPFRNRAILPADDIVGPSQALKSSGASLRISRISFKSFVLTVIVSGITSGLRISPHYSCICSGNAIALTAPLGVRYC